MAENLLDLGIGIVVLILVVLLLSGCTPMTPSEMDTMKELLREAIDNG